jgi:hypothetical protein
LLVLELLELELELLELEALLLALPPPLPQFKFTSSRSGCPPIGCTSISNMSTVNVYILRILSHQPVLHQVRIESVSLYLLLPIPHFLVL